MINRIVNSIYMGFLLTPDSNDFLSKEMVSFNIDELLVFLGNFNKNSNLKNKLNIIKYKKFENGVSFNVYGNSIILTNSKISSLVAEVNKKIDDNLKLTLKPYNDTGIEIYDFNTLDKLPLHNIGTMYSSYLGSFNKRYNVSFLNIYSVI